MSATPSRTLALMLPACLATAFAAAPASALDEDRGFYLGLSHGETEFFNDTPLCDEFSDEVADALAGEGGSFLVTESFAELVFSTDCRQRSTDNADKYFIGYRFSRVVAVELTSIDFGTTGIDLSTDVTAPGGTFRGEADVKVDVEGVSLAGLFSLPIGERVGLYARLGVLSWDAKGKGSATGSVPDGAGGRTSVSEQFVESDSGTDVHYGVGGRVRLTNHVALRAEWERYEVADLNVLSAGVELSF